MDDADLSLLFSVFQSASPEEKAAFSRVCSGLPEAASAEDMALVEPLIARARAAVRATNDPVEYAGKPMVTMNLTNYLFPHNGSVDAGSLGHVVAPTLFNVPGSGALYLACFSTAEKLREVMERLGRTYVGIKKIDDGPVFLESLPSQIDGHPLVVICDPHFTEEGKIRFTEIFRD